MEAFKVNIKAIYVSTNSIRILTSDVNLIQIQFFWKFSKFVKLNYENLIIL